MGPTLPAALFCGSASHSQQWWGRHSTRRRRPSPSSPPSGIPSSFPTRERAEVWMGFDAQVPEVGQLPLARSSSSPPCTRHFYRLLTPDVPVAPQGAGRPRAREQQRPRCFEARGRAAPSCLALKISLGCTRRAGNGTRSAGIFGKKQPSPTTPPRRSLPPVTSRGRHVTDGFRITRPKAAPPREVCS